MNVQRATVVAISPSLLVTLPGSSTPVPARYLNSYTPTLGDQVAVSPFGNQLLILGAYT